MTARLNNLEFACPCSRCELWFQTHTHIMLWSDKLNHNIDWDSAQCLTYSANYFQRLTLESWYANLDQTPLNRCQQLPAPYKRKYETETSWTNGFLTDRLNNTRIPAERRKPTNLTNTRPFSLVQFVFPIQIMWWYSGDLILCLVH